MQARRNKYRPLQERIVCCNVPHFFLSLALKTFFYLPVQGVLNFCPSNIGILPLCRITTTEQSAREIRRVFLREDDSDRLTFSTIFFLFSARESESPSWVVASVCFSLFLSVFGRENESSSAVRCWICTKPRKNNPSYIRGSWVWVFPQDCVCIKMNSLRKWLYKPKVLLYKMLSTKQKLF